MIDLHMHTINSDGTDTVEEILDKCEKLKLEYISITDHDNCDSYEDMKKIDIKKHFSGEIIPGCEMTTTYKGRIIEILGYDIDTEKVNKWMHKFHTKENKKERYVYSVEKSIENFAKLGIKINKEDLDKSCSYDRAFYRLLLKNKEENEKILGKGILDSLKNIFRRGFSNPLSPIFVNTEKYRPTPKQIVDLIHTAGGKAFLAHPYQYVFDDILQMITELRQEVELDGIEAFHSSFTIEEMLILQEYAKKNKLYISGGSDYHGLDKLYIKLKTGENGNLHISKNILEWYKK